MTTAAFLYFTIKLFAKSAFAKKSNWDGLENNNNHNNTFCREILQTWKLLIPIVSDRRCNHWPGIDPLIAVTCFTRYTACNPFAGIHSVAGILPWCSLLIRGQTERPRRAVLWASPAQPPPTDCNRLSSHSHRYASTPAQLRACHSVASHPIHRAEFGSFLACLLGPAKYANDKHWTIWLSRSDKSLLNLKKII